MLMYVVECVECQDKQVRTHEFKLFLFLQYFFVTIFFLVFYMMKEDFSFAK